MTYQKIDFLLIGGGLASATAAETLRREGATGSILILSAESTLPYQRPALSKRYLLGHANVQQILVHPAQYYRDEEIEVALETTALSVDTARQLVETSTGRQIHYEKLLIATGASPRPIALPGASLQGIHVLRSRDDCDAIRQRASKAKRAVVVGGSFHGMEVAMSLLDLGLEVTIVEKDTRLLRHLESAMLSDFFLQYACKHGATVLLDEPVVAFHGEGKIREVETGSGARIPCDFAVACTGVDPATQFLDGSGIALEEGQIMVDDRLATNMPNIWAAGDVTSFLDPVFSCRRHIEHWDNAVKQGRLAALNMLGRRMRYDQVSYFFCEVGDIGFDVLGATEDADEWIMRGSLADQSFALFYLKNSVMRAAFSLGRPARETRLAEELIRYRTNLLLHKERLREPDVALDQLPTQTVLVLQGGGALGAFECGVVKALEEEQIFPDIVAGISIGALNGAIIAGNPRNATGALEAFWSELQVASSPLLSEPMRRAATAMQIVLFGVPKFFQPRWMPSLGEPWVAPWNWTGFYDTSPMKKLLAKYVDFMRGQRRPVPARRRPAPALRGGGGRRPLGRLGTGASRALRRPSGAGAPRGGRRGLPQAAHRRRGPRSGRRGHHGLRRRLPVLPGRPVRGLVCRRSRAGLAGGCRRDRCGHRRPRPGPGARPAARPPAARPRAGRAPVHAPPTPLRSLMTDTATRPSVLFVCIHNAGRSQMAAGFLSALSGGAVEVRSAGSTPADAVNPVAVAAMAELGIDIAAERPKVLTPEAVQSSDVVVTMGCGDTCPFFPGRRYEDWVLDANIESVQGGTGIDIVTLSAELTSTSSIDLAGGKDSLILSATSTTPARSPTSNR